MNPVLIILIILCVCVFIAVLLWMFKSDKEKSNALSGQYAGKTVKEIKKIGNTCTIIFTDNTSLNFYSTNYLIITENTR